MGGEQADENAHSPIFSSAVESHKPQHSSFSLNSMIQCGQLSRRHYAASKLRKHDWNHKKAWPLIQLAVGALVYSHLSLKMLS